MSLPIKIVLPEGFLKSEVRCGYEVSAKLKKIWAVELDLLAEFDRVCEKYSIKYQIFAGTLLGAVRHRGFIPWDDDADVCMSRSDYEKLMNVANEFVHPYFLQTPYNDSLFFSTHSRLRNSLTTGVVKGQEDMRYNNGIYIDIFVLDAFVDNKFLFGAQKFVVHFLTSIITSKKGTYKRESRTLFRFLRWNLLLLSYIFPGNSLYYLRDAFVQLFNIIKHVSRVSLVTHMNWFTHRYWMFYDELKERRRYEFDGIKLWGPVDYDVVLKRIYGEYMKLPPIEERGKWHDGKILFEPDIPYREFLKKHK